MRYPSYLLSRIAETFADLYPTRGDIVALLDEAEIDKSLVNLEQSAGAVWADAIDEADKSGKVRSLLTIALRRYEGGVARDALMALMGGIEAADAQKKSRFPT